MQLIFKISVLTLISFFFINPISAQATKTVEDILMRQARDWNNGDIDAFMNGYWESDKLQFIGSKGVTYGYDKTLSNYKKRYPDQATMGKLTFKVIENSQLSRKVIMMTGKFMLDRIEKENLSGHFILIWKKIKGKWVIIADHTS